MTILKFISNHAVTIILHYSGDMAAMYGMELVQFIGLTNKISARTAKALLLMVNRETELEFNLK